MPQYKPTTLNSLPECPSFVELLDMPAMAELIGKETGQVIGEGAVINGVIVEKRDNGVIIDIGFKAEAFVAKEEFSDWVSVACGNQIRALVESIEDEVFHMPVLSVRKAQLKESWDQFIADHHEGDVIRGVVKSRVKGGFVVEIGVDAFLPGSQVDVVPVRNMDDLIGKEFELKILKINLDRKNIVVSRRELIEAEKARQRAAMMADIVPGQVRRGTVKNITDFGAFIDLNGIDGLLHITDMSWGRISHPSEMVQLNQVIEAVILDVDRTKERVSLGLKQSRPDPWDSVETRYPVGSRINGRVVNVMPYGAFVEIEEGVEGLVHISEMSWTKRVAKASDLVQVGQAIEAVILDIQRDAKKISLGLRQTMPNPWKVAAEKLPPGTRIRGKVRNLTSYGAFVEIQDDIDGMIHVSDMSWTRKVNNPSEVLRKGDEVDAVVLDIDPEQQRISLGIKQLSQDPWDTIEVFLKVGDKVRGTVRKLTNFGAFVKLDHDIDGLVHISQISNERVDKVKDYLKVGDTVEAQIIKVDKAERRVGLSIKSLINGDTMTADGGSVEGDLRPGEQMVDVGDVFQSAVDAMTNDGNGSSKRGE